MPELDYWEKRSLQTGESFVFRASTGTIETYSNEGRLTEVTGTQVNQYTGGGYIDVSPSSTIRGGTRVSVDTPTGGTKVIELTGTGTATKEQFEQGAFGVTSYDYPMTVRPENRIGLVQQQIQNAQTPIQTLKPTSKYQGGAVDKYLLAISPTNIFTPLKKQTPQAVGIREKFALTYTKGNIFFGGNYDEQLYSREEYLTDRPIFLSEMYGTDFKWNKPSTYVRNIAEGVSYGFYPQEQMAYGKGAVYQSYIDRGYSPAVATQKTDYAFRRFKGDISAEFEEEVAIGVVSNLIGGFAVAGVSKVATPLLSKSPRAIYYISRTTGMGGAGWFEGNMFASARKSYITKEKMTTKDYLVSGGVGAVSSIGAQVFIEQGFKGLIGKTTNIPVRQTLGTNIREKILYSTDPLEPVSDAVSSLSGGAIANVRVRTFTFSNAFSQPINLQYSSPVLNRDFSFTFGKSQAQTSNLPSTFIVTKTQVTPLNFDRNQVQPMNLPTAFIFPKTQPNVLPNILPNIRTQTLPNVFVFPKSQPNVFPSTMPNILPQTQPNVLPNVFVGGLAPFIPPIRGGDGFNFNFGRKSRGKKAYIPSLTAIGLNIRAKKKQRIDVSSGLNIRPIIG